MRCGHGNPSGGNFCSNCGALLQGSGIESQGPGTGTGHPLSEPRSYTPKHLAEKILSTRSVLEGERKQVTVFFVDVKESMQLAERVDAEEWHRIMDRFFALVSDGIHRYEGTINQFTGDGVMALFGAPLAHEDHAQRACHAALHLREQVRLYAQELKRVRGLTFAVRMGLNSGEVIVGTIGDDLRMDYTAQGHTVGLAARMQQIAAAGTIFLTGNTAALVGSFFETEAVGKIRLRGVREPVRTFVLVNAGPLRTRIEAARARGFSRFVGRADEMAILEAALSRAVAGHGQVVGVGGTAGVGKSRLCQEAIERWRAEGLRIVEAHCPAHGKALPEGALRDLLRSFFGIMPGERPTASRARVRSRLRRVHRGLVEELPLLLDFLGVPDPRRPLAPMDADARRRRLFAFVRRLVQTNSVSEPTVLLIDDLHWIDPESDRFLAELVDAVGWTRTLLLLNFRPDYHTDWMRTSYYQQLQLSPLTSEATDVLLGGLLGSDAPASGLCALVKARAEGNPFFVEEIVQSLVDQGVLVREPGRRKHASTARLRVARPVTEIRIPATVQSLLAARIDALAEPVKHVLQAAAVIGKRFSEPVLQLTLALGVADGSPPPATTIAEISPHPDADLAHALDALREADLIRAEASPAYPEYTFKHSLTQEVAYWSQLQETRVRKHEAVARALEVVHTDRLGEYAALLAHHWDAANKTYEARQWRRRALLRVTNIQVGRGAIRRQQRPTDNA
jgi:class 3 adenylate cyclase